MGAHNPVDCWIVVLGAAEHAGADVHLADLVVAAGEGKLADEDKNAAEARRLHEGRRCRDALD